MIKIMSARKGLISLVVVVLLAATSCSGAQPSTEAAVSGGETDSVASDSDIERPGYAHEFDLVGSWIFDTRELMERRLYWETEWTLEEQQGFISQTYCTDATLSFYEDGTHLTEIVNHAAGSSGETLYEVSRRSGRTIELKFSPSPDDPEMEIERSEIEYAIVDENTLMISQGDEIGRLYRAERVGGRVIRPFSMREGALSAEALSEQGFPLAGRWTVDEEAQLEELWKLMEEQLGPSLEPKKELEALHYFLSELFIEWSFDEHLHFTSHSNVGDMNKLEFLEVPREARGRMEIYEKEKGIYTAYTCIWEDSSDTWVPAIIEITARDENRLTIDVLLDDIPLMHLKRKK